MTRDWRISLVSDVDKNKLFFGRICCLQCDVLNPAPPVELLFMNIKTKLPSVA